jgi:hypothetical protein
MKAAADILTKLRYHPDPDTDSDDGGALEHGEERMIMLSTTSPNDQDDSIVDSGASQSAVKDRKMLTAVRRRRQAVNTVGKSINIETSGPIGPFEDVFLIPVLSHNLISVKDLNDIGVKVSFDDGTMHLQYKGVKILSINSRNRVWSCNFAELCENILRLMSDEERERCWWLQSKFALVNTRSKTQAAKSSDIAEKERIIADDEAIDEIPNDDMRKSESRSKAVRLWHNRLCHRSEFMIVNEVNAGLLKIGIPKLSRKDLSQNICECCAKAKAHKIPRPARPVVKATMTIVKRVTNPAFKSGEEKQQGFGPGIISTDSCGPYTVPSLHDNFVGNHNFMLMDSKMVFCYGYVNKTAETMVKNLRHLLDTEMKLLNLGVVRYHSDGAKELSGKEIKQLLDSHGIQQTTSTPYTAQENAFIERHFGMEQEATVAMMMYARFLPKSLWFLAKQCYNYVYALLPTQTAKGRMSPTEYLTGVTPNLEHLKVFGSKAFVNIPLSKRHKDFKDRALTGYMVGYSKVMRGAYKIWIPEWNRIIVSNDVKFDENIPQGIIDFTTDSYWLEARQYGNLVTGKPRNIQDFEYLIGAVFYDNETEEHYKV